ncbi:MAG TPA: metalloregulator ArsR/SmtB family transcription factor [Negativicutes bacterium]|nr:metalloregulator ArsR/SmtB family transcription factor [Negativicutes bacterium]
MKERECDVCTEICENPQTVCLAKAELLSDKMAQRVAETFKVLGDTTRVKILQALSKRELCVCDIAAVIGMGQSAVSHQLRTLRNSRLVKYRREGTTVWYSLDDEHIAGLLARGIEHVEHE